MTLAIVMKLFHVLAAFALITGVIGRNLTFLRAGRATTIDTVYALMELSEFFERRMVIPVSSVVLLFGLLTAWFQRWPILGFLEGGTTNWVLVSLILFILPLIAVIPFLARRRRLRSKAMEAAHALGRITPELTAALHDPLVLRLKAAELIVLVLIVILMVTKPF